MSFINGFRIVDFMSGDANLRGIPAFLMTSSDDDEIIKKIEASNAKGYLKKPLLNAESLAPLVNFLKDNK